MDNSWIECVNRESTIPEFVTEDFIRHHIKAYEDTGLNWIKVFNSTVSLSNSFILEYMCHIDWEHFTRPVSESILDVFYYKVVHWNAQLYGEARTFEFLSRHKKRFNWYLICANPPKWFTEIHYEALGIMNISNYVRNKGKPNNPNEDQVQWITIHCQNSPRYAFS